MESCSSRDREDMFVVSTWNEKVILKYETSSRPPQTKVSDDNVTNNKDTTTTSLLLILQLVGIVRI
jgi:hypothetical protein